MSNYSRQARILIHIGLPLYKQYPPMLYIYSSPPPAIRGGYVPSPLANPENPRINMLF